MLRTPLATLAILALAAPVRADRMAPVSSPVERALRVPVVVVGTVTSVEKESVDAPLYPGATQKVAHKIAVVKVGTALAGADGVTHLKVGFVPPNLKLRRGPDNPELKAEQEWLFFLTKNADGGFHAIPYMTPPVPSTAADYKAQVEAVTKTLAAVADPAKAMKSEKAADRFAAAGAIVYKLRAHPDGAAQVETALLTADESRPILKALAEGAWTIERSGEGFGGYRSFAMLGLTDRDGWKAPAAVPGEDFAETTRKAFAAWVDGPGKDYRIKKVVPKK